MLRNCLASIFNTSQEVEFEVIIVDNKSSDDSVTMIQAEFPEVVVICNQRNLGFAAANNQAFAIAQGRYILLLNNDTVVLPGALPKSLAYLDAHSKIGVLGCRVEFPDGSFQTSCYRFTNLLELFMARLLPLGSVANERLNMGRYWGRQFTRPTEVDVVAGCFMIVRREILKSVGGLDQDFFMYGEDEEWCSRIKRAGWGIIYFPEAAIVHIHRFSSTKARRALRVVECMSPVLVLHKRRGPVIAWLGNLILCCGLLLRLPVWIVLDLFHAARGNLQSSLLRSRFGAIAAHLEGIFHPVWLVGIAKSRTAAEPLTT